jgi:glycosyltransferase involved in cell wall biosynthesis
MALKDMKNAHGLNNLFIHEEAVADIESIWARHHALILPSRREGLPLVLVEAMLCARTAIVTDVGGNAEIVKDNVTGFVAAAASKTSIDEALERAWQRRSEWEGIGRLAAQKIREFVTSDPAGAFVQELMPLI